MYLENKPKYLFKSGADIHSKMIFGKLHLLVSLGSFSDLPI